MEEIWKDVEGYEGYYKVSNLGKVISFHQNTPREIYQTITNCGYKQVKLYIRRNKKQIGVHRLVAIAFVDGYKEGLEVNHKDGNKQNNRFDNLEWVTRSENQKHQFKMYGKEYKENYCSMCGIVISHGATKCPKCAGLDCRKYSRPDREELKRLIRCGNFRSVGEIFSTSDNVIRKWCRSDNLPMHSKIIKNTTDVGWENENWDDKIPAKKNPPQEKKPVFMIDKDTTIIREFESILEASLFLGNKEYSKHISNVCNGYRNTAYGYKWKFKKDIDTKFNL